MTEIREAVARIVHREAQGHHWDFEDCSLCGDIADEILAVVQGDAARKLANALRFLSNGWVTDGSNAALLEDDKNSRYLRTAADELEKPSSDWWCCPVCQEVVCDDACPVRPMRSEDQS